jgi:hypothetical protein
MLQQQFLSLLLYKNILRSFRLSSLEQSFPFLFPILVLLREVSVEVDPVRVLAATRAAETEESAAAAAAASALLRTAITCFFQSQIMLRNKMQRNNNW